MKIFLCEDSIDGIFTAIYDAWASKFGHDNIKIEVEKESNFELFAEYVEVETNLTKSLKVAKTINERLGNPVYVDLTRAALSDGDGKADAIYRVLILGLSTRSGRKVMDQLSDPNVCKIFELSRAVSNEAHHLLGFVRFSELDNGVFFSKISSKNNVLSLLATHFHVRMPMENWMIYDEMRTLAVVYQKGKVPIFVSGESIDKERIQRVSKNELEFQELWKSFFESICINERKNEKLQMQNLPKRFWDNMVEMQDNK